MPKFDGMAEWKKSSKLSPKQLDDVADFVASFAAIPDGHDARRLAQQPRESPTIRGSRRSRRNAAQCHVIDGFTEGGMRDAPKLFGWGSPQWIARMIRKPAIVRQIRLPGREAADQMPAFGADQITASDLDVLIRYLKDDYAKAVAGQEHGLVD